MKAFAVFLDIYVKYLPGKQVMGQTMGNKEADI